MADASRVIDIIFAGVDNVSGTINTVSGQMSSFGNSVEAVASPLANVADTILKIDAVLTAMAIGGMALAVREAGNFNDSFLEIASLTDATDASLATFKDSIVDYAQTSGKSFEDINGAIYSAISAGVDYSNSLDFLQTAEELSVVGRADLNATTLSLASTLNAYGESTDKASNYSDVLFTIVREGITTIPELTGVLGIVTGIAASAEIPFADLGAAIAALTAAGLPTSQALTGLRGIIAAMIKPSQEATDLAKDLGINFGAETLAADGLQKTLQEVVTATGGNIDKMAILFGRIEGLNSALILGTDKSGKFKEALEAMADRTGITAAAYATMSDNFESTNQVIANNIQAVLISIGDNLTESYAQVAGGIVGVLGGIEDVVTSDVFDPIFELLNESGANLTEFLNGIAIAMPEAFKDIDFSGLIEALGAIGDGLGELFEDIDLTNPEDLRKAIQFVINSLESLAHITEGVITPIGNFINKIIKWIEEFNSLDESSKKATGEVLGWGKVVDTIIGPLKSFFGVVQGLTTALTVLVSIRAGAAFTSLVAPITAVTASMGPAGLLGASAALGVGIGTLARQAFPQIDEGAQKLIGFMDKLLGISDFKSEAEIRLIDEEFQKAFEENKERLKALQAIKIQTEVDTKDLNNFISTIKGLPEVAQFQLVAAWKKGNLEEIDSILAGITSDKEVTFDETKTKENAEKVVAVTTTETDKIPSEKEIEILLKGEIETEIEKIKAQAATIQTAMEWKAKVDIAEAEAAARTIEAAFDAVGVAMVSTGDTLVGLWSVFANLDAFEQSALMREIERESARRDEALELQRRLTDAQIEYIDARTEALSSGQALITIDGAGLEPHLEAFMWAVVEKVQLRVIEEQSDFLLGIT